MGPVLRVPFPWTLPLLEGQALLKLAKMKAPQGGYKSLGHARVLELVVELYSLIGTGDVGAGETGYAASRLHSESLLTASASDPGVETSLVPSGICAQRGSRF